MVARTLWARTDREYVDRAAAAPLDNPYWFDFVSARVHNYQADPILGLIADQVQTTGIPICRDFTGATGVDP